MVEDIIAGIVSHLSRAFENLAGRVTGPMKFRLILQPVTAGIFAVRAALHDAKLGRTAYVWDLITTPGHRQQLLHEGWKDVGRVFMFALLIDVVYQTIVLRWVYPGEAVIAAALLSIAPYVALRGFLTRAARRK